MTFDRDKIDLDLDVVKVPEFEEFFWIIRYGPDPEPVARN